MDRINASSSPISTGFVTSSADHVSKRMFKRMPCARATGEARFRLSSVAWSGALIAAAWLATGATLARAADRYVNPSHGAAQDVGHGPATKPYRTLTYAMRQLQPGDRLIISEGTYRETIRFPNRNWSSSSKPTVLEASGRVLIKGSDIVGGWSSLGNGRFVRSWPEETAQVFVNGTELQQIGGSLFGSASPDKFMWPGRKSGNYDSMPVNSFYYDKASRRLFIRTAQNSLNGQTVEVSKRMFSMFGEHLANVTVRGLEFEHGNTSPFNRSGLVTMIGSKIHLDNLKIMRADAVGLEIMGTDNQITNSESSYNGQVGMKARGQRAELSGNVTNYNNTRGFNKWWEAGGVKFTGLGGLQNSIVTGHTAIGNQGDGIWFDWRNLNNRVENSIVALNTGFGIHYEASDRGIITNNTVVSNGQRGIYLPHSSNSVVAFNLVAGHTLQGIVVIDEGVRDKTGAFDLKPKNNKIFGNVMAWNKGALILPADVNTNKSDANLFIGSAGDTLMQLGWHGAKRNLAQWSGASGQDRASRYQSQGAIAGVTSATSAGSADSLVNWFKGYRASTAKVQVNAEWLKLVPGQSRDLYPGPMP